MGRQRPLAPCPEADALNVQGKWKKPKRVKTSVQYHQPVGLRGDNSGAIGFVFRGRTSAAHEARVLARDVIIQW